MFRALLRPSSGARNYNVDYYTVVSFLVCCGLEGTPDDVHSSARNMLSL